MKNVYQLDILIALRDSDLIISDYLADFNDDDDEDDDNDNNSDGPNQETTPVRQCNGVLCMDLSYI